MGDNYTVSTGFVAHDLYSQRLKGMESATAHFASTAKRDLRTVGQVFRGSFLGTFSAGLVTSGLARIGGALRSAVGSYVAFDTALAHAALKFPEGAARGSAAFAALEKGARDMGRTGEFSAEQAAMGYTSLAAAGFNVAQSVSALTPIMNFAESTNTDFSVAANVAAKSIRAFNMDIKDAGRVGDIYASMNARTGLSVEDMYGAVESGGAAFAASGQSLETYLAVVGQLSVRGIPATKSAMALGQAMLRISDPKIAAKLKHLGVATTEGVGNQKHFRNFIDIVGDLQKKTEGLGEVGQRAAITGIFDKRTLKTLAPMFGESTDAVKGFETSLYGATGTAKKMGDQIDLSIGDKIERIKTAATERTFDIFGGVLGTGGNIDAILAKINAFDVTPIVSGVKALGTGLGFLAEHADTLLAVAKGLVMIKGVMVASDVVKWGSAMVTAIRGIGAANAATGGVALGMGGGVGGGGSAQSALGAGRATSIMVGSTPGATSQWMGRTVTGPATGGRAMMMTPPPPPAMKAAGFTAAQGFSAGVQALGVGVAIGTAISDILNNTANDLRNRNNADVARMDDIRFQAANARTPAERAAAARKIASSAAYEKDQWSGLGGKMSKGGDFLAALLPGSNVQNPLEMARQNAAARGAASADLIRNMNKPQEVKVTLEVNGTAADTVMVKDVTTTGSKSGPTAPKVNKSKTGSQR